MIVRRSNNNNRRLRAKKNSQAHQLLELRVRRDSAKHQRTKKMNMALMKVAFLGVLMLASFLGGRALLDKFFFKNPDYNVQHLEVVLDGVMELDELQQITGLHQGMNIFLVDLSASEKILNSVPEVKKAHVERLLPNTIQVTLERRTPIFRLVSSPEEPFAPGQSFVMDQSGMVMVPKKLESSLLELPLLEGMDTSHLIAGKQLQGEKFSFAIALWNKIPLEWNNSLFL